VKLVIQVPAFNEAGTIGATLDALPRHLDGVDRIEYLVIDDGSSDGTAQAARDAGAHHVLSLPGHRGLARAFAAGVRRALDLGAEIVVNTDADNQYRAGDIGLLIQPILQGRADLVIGDRRPRRSPYYSPFKKAVHLVGTLFLSAILGRWIPDSPSGFRAMGRRYAMGLEVHSTFTYTVETIFHALDGGWRISFVPVGVNPPSRPSRLITSVPAYLGRLGLTGAAIMARYRPLTLGAILALLAGLPWLGFLPTEAGRALPLPLTALLLPSVIALAAGLVLLFRQAGPGAP
jgi:glycosyltransferase involved in cell wall biosynthesis